MKPQNLSKNKYAPYILILVYVIVTAIMAYNIMQNNMFLRGGGTSPLFRNLADYPAWIRRGFDAALLRQIPAESGGWLRFESAWISVPFSPLPDLPKRSFLSPFRIADEEFTITIPVNIDDEAISYINDNPLLRPGLHFSFLGMNWEIYFNGTLVDSQIHLNDTGKITKNRLWMNHYIPLNANLIIPGINILSMRIIGDPTYYSTGIPIMPNYLDDTSLIQKRQSKGMWIAVSTIYAFAGIYFLFLFIAIRKKRQMFYLYYAVLSLLNCFHIVLLYGIFRGINGIDDLGSTLVTLAFVLLASPFSGMFIESIGRGKVTRISKIYLAVTAAVILIMIPGSWQFRQELQYIYGVLQFAYYCYVLIYSIVYFYFKDKKGPKKTGIPLETSVVNVFIAWIFTFICNELGFLNFALFENLGQFTLIITHTGIFFILAQRFSKMYNALEESNVKLEATVKERTRELEEQTAIAVQANRVKSEFLAVMSHEIRTPLNAVIGFSELELKNKRRESSHDNIMRIHQSGSYLLGIINNILDISKIESGNVELVISEYDTAQMISDTVNLNLVRIGSKPLQFVLEIGADFPRNLTGDELRIKQILNNLLSNAIKYSDKGTIQLTVTSGLLADNSEQAAVVFSVRDTGIGIRAGDMGRLFQDYAQLDSGAARRAEGTGLGLAITKKLAEMMGGGVLAESEYGKGSCFTARIIQGIADSKGIGEEAALRLRNFQYVVMRNADDIKYPQFVNVKALAVDDVSDNLAVIGKMLAFYGIQTDTAASGQQAIEKIQAGAINGKPAYDLIFMDHMMPEMDGVETVAALRAKGLRIPVIVLTASAMRSMKEFYLEHGFDDYLEKPVDAAALDEIITKWLGKEDVGNCSLPAGNFSPETEAQRRDMLKHHFAAQEYQKNKKEKHELQLTEENREILHRLKQALLAGDIDSAEMAVGELKDIAADQAGKKLYYVLHNLIFMEETEKALEAIDGLNHV